jgi:uncharacterized protein
MAPAAVRTIGVGLAAAATIAACGGAAASSNGTGAAPTASTTPTASTARTASVVHAAALAAPPRPAAPAARQLNVLVLTETRGFHQASIPWGVSALRRLAARDSRYRLTFLPTAAVLGPALKGASAVVFLLTSGDLPLDAAGKRALVAFVQRGGGVVGFHSATDTFHHWQGFIRLIGAEFSHHRLPSTQRVIVEDRGNAATARLSRSFAIHEEFYVFKHDPRRSVHVLARLDTGSHGPDRPLVWCRRAGKGRVFYDALGHFPQTWQDPRHVALVRGGLQWALGLGAGGGC